MTNTKNENKKAYLENGVYTTGDGDFSNTPYEVTADGVIVVERSDEDTSDLPKNTFRKRTHK